MTSARRTPSSAASAPGAFDALATPVLARGQGLAVWKQIETTLAAEIRDRRYAADDRLPSEAELAQRFRVNRHTVRQALAALQQAGMVHIAQGKGAFVQQDWIDYALARRTRYSENIAHNRLLPSKQLLSAQETSAPAPVARALQLARGGKVLRAELLDEADGRPVALATMYFPAPRFAGLLELLAQSPRVTDVLQHYGISDYFRRHNRVVALLPTDEQARLLRQPRARPVLSVESVDVDTEGVPIKYGETLFSGDRVQLVVDL